MAHGHDGPDPAQQLRDELLKAVAVALEDGEVEMLVVVSRWLELAQHASELSDLAMAELAALTIRGDGRITITDEELAGIGGRVFHHGRIEDGFMLEVSTREEHDAEQAAEADRA